MTELEIIRIIGSAGGGMVVVFLLAKTGLLRISIGANGNGAVQKTTELDIIKKEAEWKGYVTEKLESLCERVDEIQESVREVKVELHDHVTNEDRSSNIRDNRLGVIEALLLKFRE